LRGNTDAFEVHYSRKSLKIPYTEQITNKEVLKTISRKLKNAYRLHNVIEFGKNTA